MRDELWWIMDQYSVKILVTLLQSITETQNYNSARLTAGGELVIFYSVLTKTWPSLTGVVKGAKNLKENIFKGRFISKSKQIITI